MIIDLKYIAEVNVSNGQPARTLRTPFNIDMKDVTKITIQQSAKNIKRLAIYPNGCHVYMENTDFVSIIRSNWPIKEVDGGDLTVVKP